MARTLILVAVALALWAILSRKNRRFRWRLGMGSLAFTIALVGAAITLHPVPAHSCQLTAANYMIAHSERWCSSQCWQTIRQDYSRCG